MTKKIGLSPRFLVVMLAWGLGCNGQLDGQAGQKDQALDANQAGASGSGSSGQGKGSAAGSGDDGSAGKTQGAGSKSGDAGASSGGSPGSGGKTGGAAGATGGNTGTAGSGAAGSGGCITGSGGAATSGGAAGNAGGSPGSSPAPTPAGSGGSTGGSTGTAGGAGHGPIPGSGGCTGGSAGSAGSTGGSAGAGSSGGAGGSAGQTGGQAKYFARFTYQQGQEAIGDFCVAYENGKNGAPVWSSELLFASNGVLQGKAPGLSTMTAYLPLKGQPVAFGFVYPGQGCETAHGNWGQTPQVAQGWSHYTVVAAPYSGEATQVWAIPDPVEIHESGKFAPGFRVVNATIDSMPLSASLSTGKGAKLDAGDFEFGAPTGPTYIEPGQGYLDVLRLTALKQSAELDWTQIDLLSISTPTTLYIGGTYPWTALACTDIHEFSCHYIAGTAD